MNFAKTIVSTLAAATLFGAQPALADAITLDPGMIGQSYTIAFDGYSGGTTVDGLTSTATFKLTGTTGTSYTFDYVLTDERDKLSCECLIVVASFSVRGDRGSHNRPPAVGSTFRCHRQES